MTDERINRRQLKIYSIEMTDQAGSQSYIIPSKILLSFIVAVENSNSAPTVIKIARFSGLFRLLLRQMVVG